MNALFVLDYGPYLITKNPRAFLLYAFMDKFKNDRNLIKFTYAELNEHFGWSNPTIASAITQLVELELMINVDKSTFQVNSPKPMSPESRAKLYEGLNIGTNGTLRKRYLGLQLASGYEKLLDTKLMFEAYQVLGKERFDIAKQLAKYFELDCSTLKCYLENDEFQHKLKKVRQEVKKAAEIAGMRISKKGKKKENLTVKELTEQLLNETHLDSTGIPIPKDEWKTQQLLRYFCILYQETYEQEYVFTSNPFSSKESRDIFNLYEACNRDSILCVSYLDWVFKVKSKSPRVKTAIGTGFCAHGGVIREFIDTFSQASTLKFMCKKTDPVPDDLADWIEENATDFTEKYDCRVMDHLYWLKEACKKSDTPKEVRRVVEKAIEMKILPPGEDNLRFI